MRLSYVLMLGLGATMIAGCGSDAFTGPDRPPLASVRLVNALSNGATVDIRAVDQVEWSPTGNGMAYRHATTYYPTEAGKPRRLRVFGGCVVSIPSTCTPAAVSAVYLDTTITFTADTRVTLVLTGSTAAGAGRGFVLVTDDPSAPPAGQIGVRLVNTSTAGIDGYVTSTSSPSSISAPPTFTAAAGPGAPSPYVNRPAGTATTHVTAAGSATVLTSATGSPAPPNPTGTNQQFNPAAGVDSPGSRFSVYYFPVVTGVTTTPTLLWLIDRNPAD